MSRAKLAPVLLEGTIPRGVTGVGAFIKNHTNDIFNCGKYFHKGPGSEFSSGSEWVPHRLASATSFIKWGQCQLLSEALGVLRGWKRKHTQTEAFS